MQKPSKTDAQLQTSFSYLSGMFICALMAPVVAGIIVGASYETMYSLVPVSMVIVSVVMIPLIFLHARVYKWVNTLHS